VAVQALNTLIEAEGGCAGPTNSDKHTLVVFWHEVFFKAWSCLIQKVMSFVRSSYSFSPLQKVQGYLEADVLEQL